MFLTSADYKAIIKDAVLNQVIEADSSLVAEVELMAQEEIESYLSQRYDVGVIFSATGTDRNPLIIMYMVDIVVFHLHSRISKREVPEMRHSRYHTVLDWLNKVNAGKLTPNLPKVTIPPDGVAENFRMGSNDKLSHQW